MSAPKNQEMDRPYWKVKTLPLRWLLNEGGPGVAAARTAAESDVGETSVIDHARLLVGATPGRGLWRRFTAPTV